MDEEKAAAYYDEMLRKGGGAARSKQGLGYGGSGAPSEIATNRFVKGSNHEDSLSRFEKENRLAAVRDKLKKRPERQSRDKEKKHRHNSSNASSDRSVSPTSGNGSGPKVSRRKGSTRKERSSSRDHSTSSSDKTARRRHGSSRRSRERSRSPKRSSRRSSSLSPRRHKSDRRSRSLSPRRKKFDRRSRQERAEPKRRLRSRSRSHSRNRQNSRSPTRRNRSRSRSRNCRSRSGSPLLDRKGKSESRKKDIGSKAKSKTYDYSKLIQGYDDMTPAEKVKAKMKLQLSETVSKDSAEGMNSEWERFNFNKDAPLDDDAKLDYFGDGTGAEDDTKFLHNTGSTFLSSISQARREAQIQEAHAAAIFGPPSGICKSVPDSNVEEESITDEECRKEDQNSINNVLSDQVLSQQQGSWRERALKLKQQKAATTQK